MPANPAIVPSMTKQPITHSTGMLKANHPRFTLITANSGERLLHLAIG
jgi:hypothetical protein